MLNDSNDSTYQKALKAIDEAFANNFKTLNLSGSNLTYLPPEIGKLTQLNQLYLMNNKLTFLPAEIGLLVNLQRLDVGSNKLKFLPKEIGNLKNIIELVVEVNDLIDIPDEIGFLVNMKGFYFGNNKVKRIPCAIGLLVGLERLDFKNNDVTELPEELGGLVKLKHIDFDYHKINGVPNEILVDKEVSRILEYIRERKSEGAVPLSEVKLLLVGEPETGKSSVVEQLMKGTHTKNRKPTDGIVIEKWKININNRDIQVNLWDFGGQEIMHHTHRFFLTERSLYLLVLDARRDPDQNKEEYWLKIIKSVSADAPVIVVVNHIDEQPQYQFRERTLKGKFPNIRKVIRTSCVDNEGIDSLRDEIIRQIEEMKVVDEVMPESFMQMKKIIEDDQRPYFSYLDFTRLCIANGINEDEKQIFMAGLLHDLGCMLHFDEPELYNTHVLKPAWVTNGVYKILLWPDLMRKYKGILEINHLNDLLDKNLYPQERHRFLIALLEKFELCFPLADTVPEKFLVPQLLEDDERATGDWSESLHFEYHYDLLPPAIISRFIVKAHRLVELKTWWRTGVVLIRSRNRALVRSDEDNRRIEIFISGLHSGRREFLGLIRNYFDDIHDGFPGIIKDQMVYVFYDGKFAVRPVFLDDLLRLYSNGEIEYSSPEIGRVKLEEIINRYEPLDVGIGAQFQLRNPTSQETPKIHAEDMKREAEQLAAEERRKGEEEGKKKMLEKQATLFANRWLRLLYGIPISVSIAMFAANFVLGWYDLGKQGKLVPWHLRLILDVPREGWQTLEFWTWAIPVLTGVIGLFYTIVTLKDPNPRHFHERIYERQRDKLFKDNGLTP